MTILVLAGTEEARKICATTRGLPVIASLVGVTRRPRDLGVETRIGGFGGAAGFADFLRKHQIRAVIDATHPFATMVPRTAAVCQDLGLPCLRVLRAGWSPLPGMTWTRVASLEAARAALPADSVTFLATGAGSIPAFAGMTDRTLWLRRADPSPDPAPWPNGGYVVGLPSENPEEEAAVFQDKGITHLIAKDAGGQRGFAKLVAADRLGLKVLMVDRPAQPTGIEVVETVPEALVWMGAHV